MKQRKPMFPEMWRVVPEGQSGNARVEHFVVDDHASRMTAQGGGREFVPPGKYARLLIGGQFQEETVMSDTPYERRTNYHFVAAATGRVLIAGYGLGMVLTAVLKKPGVREVVVVENNEHVPAIVDPHIRTHVGARAARKLHIVIGDIFQLRPFFADRFDAIWFDIWGCVGTDALSEMATLTRRYRALKAPGGFVDCWDREWLRYQRERERRCGW